MHRAALALALDLVLIVVFAIAGRRTHEEGSAIGGTLVVAAPFLIGYVVAAAAVRLDRSPASLRRAVPAWLGGIALGMLLRGTAFDRGTAASFVVVAFVATGVLLLGWRVLALLARRRLATS